MIIIDWIKHEIIMHKLNRDYSLLIIQWKMLKLMIGINRCIKTALITRTDFYNKIGASEIESYCRN